MIARKQLPKWLDGLIFGKLNAKYCRSMMDMSVIDWKKEDMLNYLGTYFPRSYVESFCIFQYYLSKNKMAWGHLEQLSIFDFCCGTGGEIVGLLDVVQQELPNIKSVRILAFDGNQCALRLFETVIKEQQRKLAFTVEYKIFPFEIDDFYDLHMIDQLISEKYDIILSFKAVCEFVSKERFECENAYAHICRSLLPKLNLSGVMLLVDVTTYNTVSQEWLPLMLDRGLDEANVKVLERNVGYNQVFEVCHSKSALDISKVAWRLLKC